MPVTRPAWLQDVGGGVHAIDTAFLRDEFDAAYLIVRQRRAAFVDTGTNFAVPRLLGALRSLGLARDAVDWVIPTHVHLDHAGGVGALMRELPAHGAGAPARRCATWSTPAHCTQGALAVYGPRRWRAATASWCRCRPDRVQSSSDGMTVDLGGSPLRLIDTPGHARHHHCIWDAATRGWFTGDTFGISYPEFTSERGRWIFPTSTPVQFEPEVLRASVQRLLAADPACMYLTHYSRVDEVDRLAAMQLGCSTAWWLWPGRCRPRPTATRG
jgi:glyoxylase-like metal-dependent hydrolase (beta-lactamase superfamily II)